jgi:hypothetical protein
VDYARAADFTRRKRWRELLADTRHRRIDLVAVAEFERDLIRERVVEGLENALRKGSRLGRPRVLARPGFEERWLEARVLLVDQQIGKREAARQLKVGARTLDPILAAEPDLQLLAATDEALVQSVQNTGATSPSWRLLKPPYALRRDWPLPRLRATDPAG